MTKICSARALPGFLKRNKSHPKMKTSPTKAQAYHLSPSYRRTGTRLTVERYIPLGGDIHTCLNMQKQAITMREEISVWLVADLPSWGYFKGYSMRIRLHKRFWGLRMSLAQWLVRNQKEARFGENPFIRMEVRIHQRLPH